MEVILLENIETLGSRGQIVKVANGYGRNYLLPKKMAVAATPQNRKWIEQQRVRFLNAVMDSEFRKALETLAMGHDTQKKAVSINFAGDGRRQVKVGYVIENPVWKTSYRLVLPAKDAKNEEVKKEEKKPYLQGWAVVENQTDEDWGGIRMALISGRPISFQMNHARNRTTRSPTTNQIRPE